MGNLNPATYVMINVHIDTPDLLHVLPPTETNQLLKHVQFTYFFVPFVEVTGSTDTELFKVTHFKVESLQ